MQIEHLVNRLAADLQPVRHRSFAGDALILALVCTTELALYLAVGAARPDLNLAVQEPSFWWKVISLGLLAGIGGAVAITSFNPAESPRRGLFALVGVAAVCLAAGWGVDAARDGWPSLSARLDWVGGARCVVEMGLLSVPAIVGLGVLMRRGAPTDPAASAITAGAAAAAWGAFVFAFACPDDDPLYIAVWYLVGCGLVCVLSRVILPRLAQW